VKRIAILAVACTIAFAACSRTADTTAPNPG